MGKVLIIAYHFHPDLEVGAVRSIKFAKYLSNLGWKPFVVTIDTKYIPRQDHSDLNFECEIVRTSKWPTPDDFYLRAKSLIRGRRKLNNDGAANLGKKINLDTPEYTVLSNKSPLCKRLFNSLSATPDERIGWLIPAAYRSIRVIKKEKIDIIYSSGPPYTSHLVAYLAKLFTGKKWIADFRDPWTTCIRLGSHFNALSTWIEKRMERAVISRADHILTATPAIAAQLSDIYPKAISSKCTTVHNGFDEEDFYGKKKETGKDKGRVNFLYAGTLYLGRDPSPIIQAIGELILDGRISKSEIKLEFVGNFEFGDSTLRGTASKYGLEDIVIFSPPVDRSKYFDLILNSGVLILMQSDMAKPQIPGKTYEYLATGNPIFALVPDGATSDLLSDFNHALISDPGDKERIKECIINLLRNNDLAPDEKSKKLLAELTRKKQTAKLALIMEKLKSLDI